MLRAQTFSMFEEHFLKLKSKSGGRITTKTAAEIGCKLTVGILAPISSQIDPLRLGEVERAINIAFEYGNRLKVGKDALARLVLKYPSHSFVIDYEEAKQILGKKVQQPSAIELRMEAVLFEIGMGRIPEEEEEIIGCLYSKITERDNEQAAAQAAEQAKEQTTEQTKESHEEEQSGRKSSPSESSESNGDHKGTRQDVPGESIRKESIPGNGSK